MKLSTRVRYGTRALLDLAVNHGEKPVFLKDVAKRQDISLKYLDRILSSLKAAGLVKTLRGAKGGYVLNNQPSTITLAQIIEAIDGPMELVGCVHSKSFCKRSDSCVMREVWAELEASLEEKLRATSLEDLVVREKNKKTGTDKMYFI